MTVRLWYLCLMRRAFPAGVAPVGRRYRSPWHVHDAVQAASTEQLHFLCLSLLSSLPSSPAGRGASRRRTRRQARPHDELSAGPLADRWTARTCGVGLLLHNGNWCTVVCVCSILSAKKKKSDSHTAVKFWLSLTLG